jgi:hypothetical protein
MAPRPSFGELAYHEFYRDHFEPRDHFRPLWEHIRRRPVAGLLSGIRRQPLLCEGDLVARALTREEHAHAPDTYPMGHGH